VVAELAQRQHLQQFVEGAEAAGQDDEGTGHDQARDVAVADLALQEPGRNQPDHLAAGGDRGVGHGAHQPDVAAAVDHGQAGRPEEPAQLGGERPVRRVEAVARAAEDADAPDHEGLRCTDPGAGCVARAVRRGGGTPYVPRRPDPFKRRVESRLER
jgi:hypothetical protein